MSNVNLRTLGANVYNKKWTESDIEKKSDAMLTSFIGTREEVLRTMSEKMKRPSLMFDMSEKKKVRFGKHLVWRFPVQPDSGTNTDLAPQKGSKEYSELSEKITIPKKQDGCGHVLSRSNS
jgi:hypothetical protein